TPPNADAWYRAGFLLTLMKDHGDAVMPLDANGSFTLHPNYPNPFNPGTVIPVELRASGHCTLQVLDLMGKVVAVPHDGFLEAGAHRFGFDARDLPSGVYSYRVIMDGATLTRPMLLLR
ncbi:MAG: T9SS type A sorting domain-containing protein, partial [Bacteroidetes bacterium]|nr:T9SS type A sorting domain-containing protein [Bacteroidota bacterium]